MILFMHGLMSNRIINTKYKAIKGKKICKTVKYHTETYDRISGFYDTLIRLHKPKLIVGHSMGGYWAIKKSKEYGIPCIAMNPHVKPRQYGMFDDYENLTLDYFTKNVYLHLELGDAILNMEQLYKTVYATDCEMNVFEGGSHFVKYTDAMNATIDKILKDVNNEVFSS